MKRTARKSEVDGLNAEIPSAEPVGSFQSRSMTDQEASLISLLDDGTAPTKLHSRTITPIEVGKLDLASDEYDKHNNLTFIAIEPSVITFINGDNIQWQNLMISKGGAIYHSYRDPVELEAGETLFVTADNIDGTALADSSGNIDACRIDVQGLVDVRGSILSLCQDYEYHSRQLCFARLFKNAEGLHTAPTLDIDFLQEDSFDPIYSWSYYYTCCEMFMGCTNLINVSSISGSGISFAYSMYEGCSSLVSFGKKFNVHGENSCCRMFANCTSLATTPPISHAVEYNEYSQMFLNCTNLRKMAQWTDDVARPMVSYAYVQMYRGCTKLNEIYPLNETDPSIYYYGSPYSGMFKGCTSLREIPEGFFPLINYGNISDYPELYKEMFMGCTSLEKAQNLPYTTLSDYCYASMFAGCSKLVTAAEMGTVGHYGEVNLAVGCCESMYEGCTRLEYAPKLATYGYLPNKCFKAMLKSSGVYAYGEFHIDDDAMVGDMALYEMYANAGRSLRLYSTYPDPPEEELHIMMLLVNNWTIPPSEGLDCYTDMFKGLWQEEEEPTLYADTPFFVNYIR